MIQSEFCRPVPVGQLGPMAKTFEITASEAELQALAKRFNIVGVSRLGAAVQLQMVAGGPLIRAQGRFEADVVQSCVVTLEPIAAHIAESFDLTYGPSSDDDQIEIVIDLNAEDPPEPIIGGAIDIGEAVAEHLALSLDPFPRVPGAVFNEEKSEVEAPQRPNPFDALATLKKK